MTLYDEPRLRRDVYTQVQPSSFLDQIAKRDREFSALEEHRASMTDLRIAELERSLFGDIV
jgi:hypothetical protein